MRPGTPEWLVERLHARDLPADEADRVRARLTAEDGLPRLDALGADDAAFRVTHPAAPALAEIRRRAGLSRARARPRAWRPVLGLSLAAAAAVAVVVLVPRGGPLDRPGAELRTKGARPQLEIHRSRPGAGPERLSAGAEARAGDLLQLAYVAAGAGYGVVVSVDGRGGVTLHWPEEGGPAAALQGGGAVPLAHAYQLDDSPGFERFFLVTGRAPFDSTAVVEAARRLAASGAARTGALELPPGLAQQAVLLRKGG